MFFFFYLSLVFSDGEIKPGPTAGNYANANYVNLRRIDASKFTVEANGGEQSDYPLSNAFDNKANTYWVSKTPNSASFMNTITINFDKVTTLEAILMDTAYTTNRDVTPNVRTFWGYPTILNVYASTINNRYELVAAFKGNQVNPTTRVQFVFPDAVKCKKLRLDFVEVTNQSMKPATIEVGPNPTIGDLLLLRYAPTIETKSPVGDYAKEEYVTKNKIPKDDFTVVANGGEDSNYPLSNAFDGVATSYWASSQPNTDSFKNALTFDFGEPLSIEAFLMDTAYSTNGSVTPNTRAYWGYPTTLNVYTAKGNDDFQLAAVFVGTPVHPMTRIQFAFSTPISCSRLKLEYADITPQFLTNDKGTLKANIGELILIRNDDKIPIAGEAGNYVNKDYLALREIPINSYTLISNGGNLNDNRKLEYGFDGKDNTYHISGTPNSEDFTNTFTINFLEIQTLEAFLYWPAFFTNKATQERDFEGFPTILKVYTSPDNNNDFELVATFAGNPAQPMKRIQFVFPTPITCKKIRLSFVEVTEVKNAMFVSSPAKYACIGDIKFVKYNEPLEIDGASGKYADSAYISERKIPSNSFTTSSRSNSRDRYPLSNLYDGKTNSYWIAGQANNDKYNNWLEINFNQLVSLEAFLMDTAFTTNRNTNPYTRTFLGYPTILNVFVSTGNSYNPVATFSGTPVYPMDRIQYVFLEPITCSKIKLEFDEVTFDSLTTNDYTPYLAGLIFVRSDIKPTSPPTPEIGEGDYTFSDSNCNNKNDHCDITISDEKYVNIIIAKTDFNSYETDESGGAIYLVNTGLKSGDSNSRITFTNCRSRSGGGGAIYIRNEFENIENKISIYNNVFEGCSAVYGGSIYIYSKAVRCEINNSFFNNNKLIKSNAKAPFNSGSAIFLTYRDGGFSYLFFDGGEDHLIQIYNNFNTRPSSVLSEKDVVFKDCTFINSQNTKSSIYFIGGKYGSQYIVKNCHFKGKMQDGLYYIDGDAISKNARKLLVDSCDFESDAKMAFNTNSNIEFLQAHSKKKSSNVSSENIVPALAIFMMVAIAAVTLMIIKKNGNAVDNSSTHEETQELDHNYSLDQQLI